MQSSRSLREKAATDDRDTYQHWHALRKRWSHIHDSPNSQWAEQQFDAFLAQFVPGKRILEIGCGMGALASRLSALQAQFVLAVDISETRITQAKTAFERPGLLEFAMLDVSESFEGVFDVIVGRAVVHHLDYREALVRFVQDNLSENGVMLFYEPLGSNPLMRLFQRFTRQAHTDDEHPFETRDLRWLQETFAFTFIPVNFFSLFLGALSSLLFKRPDNWLLRLADRADRLLTKLAWLRPYFRYGIFVLRTEAR